MISEKKPGKISRYGMSVDIDKCTGCGACMIACAVENNVPPAQEGATDLTGLTWMRVFKVDNGQEYPAKQSVYFPMMCQHCGLETPCYLVCPQQAVDVDPATGIVGQIPGRCLGCRYCMAACPYHARYFNWWDPKWPAGMEKTLNPNVAPRMRGVVEKCNFCHGRWHAAKERAAAAGKDDIDAAVTTLRRNNQESLESERPVGERLLTQHNFARLSGGNRNRCMQIIGRTDVDDVHVFPLYYGFPIACDFFPAPPRSHFLKLRLIPSADHLQVQFVGGFTKMADLMEGVGVRSSHEPLADHRDIQSFPGCHACLPKTLRKARTMSCSSRSVRHEGIASKMLRSNSLSAIGQVPL